MYNSQQLKTKNKPKTKNGRFCSFVAFGPWVLGADREAIGVFFKLVD